MQGGIPHFNALPLDISTNWPEEQERRSNFDRRKLPSAPRASIAAEIDLSRLPSKPPYTVYLGNLSYECSEDDISQLFDRKKLRVRCIEVYVVVLQVPIAGTVCASSFGDWDPAIERVWICRV